MVILSSCVKIPEQNDKHGVQHPNRTNDRCPRFNVNRHDRVVCLNYESYDRANWNAIRLFEVKNE